ncbi:phage protein [Paenibacillus sp. FSL R7-0273]|uniref:DUF2800 domain-containing protein n=1 Tax=Paenibacillus sp. FSL R7-0273 TaxID=1536772 RepID=UPI0004F82764|nr:DUF2800 domain-containing protein [Paenibacillus sp. FSL R7-0273]AIQ45599.1 phage protein [Paenibacillus sp. FSL R7-0273]OMF95116.1 hypothetical protein BK144_06160 [Paenibacillus sp. FSL R7-0273]
MSKEVGAHAERDHAILSASGSKKWLTCTPSARLEEKLPEKRSVYSDEGSAAHELSEIHLAYHLGQLKPWDHGERWKEAQKGPYYSREMEDYVHEYVGLVLERVNTARAKSTDVIVLLEERLDYSAYAPEGRGTGDVVIIADGCLEIIDLKYGKGVPVSAIDNSQMRLYALGAVEGYDFLYDIQTVRMTIVQIRLDSISEDVMTVEALREWGESIKPAAARAWAGEGEFVPGPHCSSGFCKARFTCKARTDFYMAATQYEFKDPALMTLEDISAVLYVAPELQKWAKELASYAFEQATKHGAKIPSWKLVEGRSDRVIRDKSAAMAALAAAGVPETKYLKPQDLQGIGELEKIGKKELAKILDGLIIKPESKPVLVPESDPRSVLNNTRDAFADINLED